ncbi:hypothetical protein SUGI_0589070 [Cryptomeria japonica]|nr:hypothetical protein SUGI_0589070 [Cryptomeria japonica]
MSAPTSSTLPSPRLADVISMKASSPRAATYVLPSAFPSSSLAPQSPLPFVELSLATSTTFLLGRHSAVPLAIPASLLHSTSRPSVLGPSLGLGKSQQIIGALVGPDSDQEVWTQNSYKKSKNEGFLSISSEISCDTAVG